MLKVQEIRELIKLIDESTIDEFTYESNGTTVTMKKNTGEVVERPAAQPVAAQQPAQPAPQPQPEPTQAAEEPKPEPQTEAKADYDHEIVSPMVGTFYEASSPDAGPFVKTGDVVTKDSVVCIVEAMKLFNEIEAEVNGKIVEVLVENGQLVEYGQPLFRVKSE
ncbi:MULTISPECIES: acetyl-CoA carboxylase biotin carboxyl carrier protein [Pontibacillus]|uniref:Biotin carboxyl carrier protein of acetyl-CoA carboxylase n=1 Tax=Pontibacillus chungwhensis TaxID=265426 RepID=A0ABY8UU78_9BACI|nr:MULTISPECIES: acetyl-CoA carboxylase biotin carboxyl carrier protein [Pontibacillus]MCD5323519.1 acetyl-CoA carboxylase biotin carboxyl carrier protein [Pontibacillus sp. HN14]WIF96890.1 acetyl-CoA carboxylase biotin carboxyl carrier protein [Pontibacillus chungwhensis]